MANRGGYRAEKATATNSIQIEVLRRRSKACSKERIFKKNQTDQIQRTNGGRKHYMILIYISIYVFQVFLAICCRYCKITHPPHPLRNHFCIRSNVLFCTLCASISVNYTSLCTLSRSKTSYAMISI